MTALTSELHDVEKGIQLSVQEKSSFASDLYTAGIFWDKSHYGSEKHHNFTDFYRIDSDYPKDKCSRSFANLFLHALYTCASVW